jgi:hypothetical protein
MRPLPLRFLTLFTLCATALAGISYSAGFEFKENGTESLDVLQDGKLIARYMTAYDTSSPARKTDTYKPYLHVFDLEGSKPITKGPGGTFPHHRGIFIGWNKLNVAGTVYDRWHMKGGDQIHRKFLQQQAGADNATFTSVVEWMGKDNAAPILLEERTFQFLPAKAPAYAIIDTVSTLKAIGGETALDGDPEHAGLQFRPANEVVTTATKYLFPGAGANAKKDKDYPWFAETFTLDGKQYTVAYLNHPGNPKGAAISAYRDYGRFGAFFKDTIPANGERAIRARFIICQGDMLPADVIQEYWNDYARQNQPTPETTLKNADKPAPPKAKTSATSSAPPQAAPQVPPAK